LVILRFELKDVHLEAFYHLSHAPSPFSISFFFFFFSTSTPGQPHDCGPLTSASSLSGITSVHYHVWSLTNVFLRYRFYKFWRKVSFTQRNQEKADTVINHINSVSFNDLNPETTWRMILRGRSERS
jgi:hypothetical protein